MLVDPSIFDQATSSSTSETLLRLLKSTVRGIDHLTEQTPAALKPRSSSTFLDNDDTHTIYIYMYIIVYTMCIHVHIHVYIHMHIHMYIHMYIHA